MNGQRDPDAILAAWLEEGPNRLPEQTRRAISFSTRTTEQQRRSLWSPWRTPRMTIFARVAVAAIALIAVIGGSVYFMGTQQGVGGPQPTPSPSATSVPSSAPVSPSPEAGATVPTDWTSYTSSRFAYTIDYPTDWVLTPATMDWPAPAFPAMVGGFEHDTFGPPYFGSQLNVSSVPLEAGKGAADWLVGLDHEGSNNDCQWSTTRTVVVDGVDARRREGVCMSTDQIIEIAVASDNRFYLLNLFGTPSGPFTDVNHATLDQFLASFRFDD